MELSDIIVKPPKRKRKREIDTAAMYLFHQVVLHKEGNKASAIDGYYYKEYTKLNYSDLNPSEKFLHAKIFKPYRFFFEKIDSTTEPGNRFIPIFLQEDFRETYYRKKPKKTISIIHYLKISGVKNPAFVKLIGYHFTVSDAYENTHIVFQKSFAYPFAPDGAGLYNFHILDTAKIDGRTSYKLNFVGRVHNDLCEKGYAWIDSATWGIKFISYGPDEKANLDYIYKLVEEQNFELVDSTHWMMTRENQIVEGNLLKNPKKIALRFQKTTVRKDIRTNVIMPDSISKSPDDIVDAKAYRRKPSYLDSLRLDSLTMAEQVIYQHFDSAKHVPATKGLLVLETLITTANVKAGPLDFGRLYRVISKNNVEGWRPRMGVRTNSDLSDKLYLGAYGAYGTRDKTFKYSFNARTLLPAKYDRWHAIELEYKTDMLVLGQENELLTYDNITTLIGGYNLTKVMKTREINLYYERDWVKGLSSNITLSDKTFYAVPGVFQFMKTENGTLVNLPSFNTNEISADLRYCKTDYYYQYYTYRNPLQSRTPSITLKYTLGIKNNLLKGDYTYHKFTLEFLHRWQMGGVGYSKIRLRAGYILGNAPFPLAFISSSDIGFLRDDLAFQSTAPFEFVTDKFFMAWWEHYFEGFFLNRIPYIGSLHLREFIQCKALIGQFSSQNKSLITINPYDLNTPFPVPYVEVGCGIENILKIFQVGFFWRCDLPQ